MRFSTDLLLLATLTAVIAPCEAELPLTTMEHGGLNRTYRLYKPPQLDRSRPAPLVLVLHGAGGESGKMVQTTHFNTVADAHGFIVAYVDGFEKHWNDLRGIPEWTAHSRNVDDVGFFAALIGKLTAEGGVDPRRVYVTGISNGGLMTHRLGCELADKITAVAPVVRTFTRALADGCKPAKPLPVLMFFGTADKLVPFEGGVQKMGSKETPVLSAHETIAKWAALDGCAAAPKVTRDVEIESREYRQCRDNTRVTAYILEGGTHSWPSGASETIWKFFAGQ
jgi:polyhydroxybutyrate depolymerase